MLHLSPFGMRPLQNLECEKISFTLHLVFIPFMPDLNTTRSHWDRNQIALFSSWWELSGFTTEKNHLHRFPTALQLNENWIQIPASIQAFFLAAWVTKGEDWEMTVPFRLVFKTLWLQLIGTMAILSVFCLFSHSHSFFWCKHGDLTSFQDLPGCVLLKANYTGS